MIPADGAMVALPGLQSPCETLMLSYLYPCRLVFAPNRFSRAYCLFGLCIIILVFVRCKKNKTVESVRAGAPEPGGDGVAAELRVAGHDQEARVEDDRFYA